MSKAEFVLAPSTPINAARSGVCLNYITNGPRELLAVAVAVMLRAQAEALLSLTGRLQEPAQIRKVVFSSLRMELAATALADIDPDHEHTAAALAELAELEADELAELRRESRSYAIDLLAALFTAIEPRASFGPHQLLTELPLLTDLLEKMLIDDRRPVARRVEAHVERLKQGLAGLGIEVVRCPFCTPPVACPQCGSPSSAEADDDSTT